MTKNNFPSNRYGFHKNCANLFLKYFKKKSMIKILVISLLGINLIACVNVASKPIEYREVVHDSITNKLEFGDNQNNIDVTQGEKIIPLKHPRFNVYFDTYQPN